MNLINDYSYYHVILWKRGGLIRNYNMLFLSFEFFNEDFDYIMFLKFDFPLDIDEKSISDLIKSLEEIYLDYLNPFIILTKRREAPLYLATPGEFIYSFSCDFQNFKKTTSKCKNNKKLPKDLLFKLLDEIISGNSTFKKILIRQIPVQHIQTSKMNYCDVIIPHRGRNSYLMNSLFFLDQHSELKIYIGLDQKATDEMLEEKRWNSKISFFNFSPNPLGPYVIRNQLIDRSNSELIFFQDSDDISSSDRFEQISYHMAINDCQFCGSHEIKLNYFNKTIQAVRYPKNVTDSLRYGPGHSLLLPSSAITRRSFYLCEKLSEERVFGNDTKFLYYSFFILSNIQNIDEFLYIRRVHPDSLTTSINTGIGSPARTNLISKLVTDFQLVKLGKLKLGDSCLKYERCGIQFNVNSLF